WCLATRSYRANRRWPPQSRPPATALFEVARAGGFALPSYTTWRDTTLGGLVGYNFGPVITQFYLTRDVAESNYDGYDTRFWTRVIVPLWNPDASPPHRPLITK
ncbi:MAG TPA: hypothetical protein VGC77_16780, partial [Rhodopseudomonas sp.]